MRTLVRSSVALLSLLVFAGACTDRQPTEPIAADALLLATTGDGGLVLWDGTVAEESHGSHEVITTQTGDGLCRLTTFEGGGQFAEIHPELGFLIPGSNARFVPNSGRAWRTLTSGPFANNPSGVTILLMTASADCFRARDLLG